MAFHSFGGWKASLFAITTCTDERRALLHEAQDSDDALATGTRAGAEFVMPTMR